MPEVAALMNENNGDHEENHGEQPDGNGREAGGLNTVAKQEAPEVELLFTEFAETYGKFRLAKKTGSGNFDC